jgi:hypothetical protein
VRLGEVDVDAAPFGPRCVAGHLASLVPRQGATQRCGDAFEDLDQRCEGGVGAVVFGEVGEPQVPACAVEHGGDRVAVERADDEVAVEVADLGALLGDLGAATDQVELAERAGGGRHGGDTTVLAAPAAAVQTGA